jgi:hypothetical protein
MQKSTKIENCSMEADAVKLEGVRRVMLDTFRSWNGKDRDE